MHGRSKWKNSSHCNNSRQPVGSETECAQTSIASERGKDCVDFFHDTASYCDNNDVIKYNTHTQQNCSFFNARIVNVHEQNCSHPNVLCCVVLCASSSLPSTLIVRILPLDWPFVIFSHQSHQMKLHNFQNKQRDLSLLSRCLNGVCVCVYSCL